MATHMVSSERLSTEWLKLFMPAPKDDNRHAHAQGTLGHSIQGLMQFA